MNHIRTAFSLGLFLGVFISSQTLAKSEVLSPISIDGTVKIDAEGVIDLVDKFSELTIIDSRIEADRKQGYIEGSISLPNTETNCETLSKIIKSYSHPALFYCNGIKCGRSAKAIKIALSCGYSKLYWFRGGYEEWLAKGYPVVGSN